MQNSLADTCVIRSKAFITGPIIATGTFSINVIFVYTGNKRPTPSIDFHVTVYLHTNRTDNDFIVFNMLL